MSYTSIEAQDDTFAVALSAWNAVSSGATIYFPGDTVNPAPDAIYAKASWRVVNAQKAAIGKYQSLSLYQEVALFMLEIFAPKSDAGSMRAIQNFGEAVKQAFRSANCGDLWFKDQRSSPVHNNPTMNQVNVFVTCTYTSLE